MSFIITLSSNKKRLNSTKQPEGTSLDREGVLRDNCTIENPIIGFSFAGPWNEELKRTVPMTAEYNPYSFNYAEIEVWKRKYWIDTWEWADGLWWAHMSVDVLASYKDEIGDSEKYVLRSTSEYNYDITDALYPAKNSYVTKQTKYSSVGAGAIFTGNVSEGTFLLSVIGGTNGSTSTFILSASQMEALNILLYPRIRNTDLITWVNNTFSEAVVGGITTLMQYINFIKWIPVKYDYVISHVTTESKIISLGTFPLNYSCDCVTGNTFVTFNSGVYKFSPRDTALRGHWEYLEPFAEYFLYYPPVGNIRLDSDRLVGIEKKDPSVQIQLNAGVKLYANLFTGDFSYKIYYGNDSDNDYNIQVIQPMNLAVDIKISGQGFTGQGYFNAVVGGAAIGLGAYTKNLDLINEGAVTASHVANYSKIGSSGNMGNGVYANLTEDVYTVAIYYDIVDENIEEYGRPLYEITTISSLSGYVKVADGDVNIDRATKDELYQIKNYLEDGFFYE